MKKIRVLEVTDAKGYEQSYYSEQLKALLEDKHIAETQYFLTDNNIVIDIDKDIDKKDIHIKKAIEAGAVIRNMFYVEDNNFSKHIYGFNAKGVLNGVEHGEEHGVIFEYETNAKKYEQYIDKIKVRDEFLEEMQDIEDIDEIFFCKKIGKVVAPEFIHFISSGEDDIREISESNVNKVYKKGKICPLGMGYLIDKNEWQWLEDSNEENFDTIYITAYSENDNLKELCDYNINEYEVGGNCDSEIYIKIFNRN